MKVDARRGRTMGGRGSGGGGSTIEVCCSVSQCVAVFRSVLQCLPC